MDEGTGHIDALINDLRRVRARARALLVAQRVVVLVGIALAVVFGEALLDLLVRLPMALRTILLLGGIGAAIWAVRRHVVPAVRFEPTLTDIALRIERLRPELRGKLASAVDFAGYGGRGDDGEFRAVREALGGDAQIGTALSARVVREVSSGWGWSLAAGVVRGDTATRRGGALGAGLVVLLVIAVLSPTMFFTGAARVLAPWSGAEWPKRTGIADATGADVHALGTALAMRAALTKHGGDPDRADVAVRWRVVDDGEVIRTRSEAMTWQGRTIDSPEGSGELFERLIEPSGDYVEYRFESEDDETAWARVRLVEPPAVVGATATITPPDYVGGEAEQLTVDLGPGTDERAIAPVSLAGSRVELAVELNKEAVVDDSVRAALGADGAAAMDGSTWRASWVLGETTRLALDLVDEYEIESTEPAVFRFEARADREASATIIEPANDETVLPGAVVEVVGEARDDVGVRWVTIERLRMGPAGDTPSGPGGALEAMGEAVEAARVEGGEKDRALLARTSVDLAGLGVSPGEEVHLTAVALDVYAVEGVVREPTRSAVRVLRVISEAQFAEEVRGALADVRQSAIRIETRQSALRERLNDRGADEETARGQSQVSERIERQREAIAEIAERAARNNLEDEALADMLAAARESLEAAERSSARASEAVDAAQRAAGEQAKSQAQEAASDAQEETEQELANLIEMLDRGEDNWVVQNAIENLLRDQQALQDRTQRAARQTAGRESSELSAGEQAEQESIVREQEELQERMEDVQRELRERAEAMREADLGTAQGMERAAERAEEQQIAQNMEQAAQAAQQNQMTRAGENQQEAVESLEEMLEDLEDIQRAQEEALKRIVRSIIESLDRLIEVQTREIALLDGRVEANRNLDGLDQGMIALNANTLGVLDTARAGGAELAPVASLLDKAAEAQTRAVQGLRAVERDSASIREYEARSLELLTRAKERAEEVEQAAAAMERDRKLNELRKAYREVLEGQVELRVDMGQLAALDQLSRRDRVMVRRGGETQDALRVRLDELLNETRELQEAAIFEYTHKRAVRAMERSAGNLIDDVDPVASLPSQERAIRAIGGLIEALADPKPDESPFDEGAQQAGGGSGGSGGQPPEQPLIPPVKELRLLRALQGDLAEFTVDASDAGDAALLDEAGEMQQELFELGEGLLQRISEQAPGGGAGGMELTPEDQDEDSDLQVIDPEAGDDTQGEEDDG